MIRGPLEQMARRSAQMAHDQTNLYRQPGVLSYVWMVSQVTSTILTIPVLIQWTLGFFWLGGIQSCGPSESPAKAKQKGAASSGGGVYDPLLSAGEEGQISGSPLLCFRVCTRGDNPVLVHDVCRRNAALLSDLGVPSVIEVVTDQCLGLTDAATCSRPNPDKLSGCVSVVQIVVPGTYKTARGTLYKARALNYALGAGVSFLHDDDVLVHLDEETLLHQTSVQGILNFVNAAPVGTEKDRRIGQGMIVYGHGDILQLVLTCADSLRVADDYCRFRMFLSSGSGAIGIHGSFVVCRARTERDVTFDFGPAGSVTEDAFFAVAAAERGYSFEFIDGYMKEKSPFSVMDFLKQRRRWIQGIRILARSDEFTWRRRCLLRLCSDMWFLAPLNLPGAFIFAAAIEFHAPMLLCKEFLVFQGVACATCFWVYVFGACYNFASEDRPLFYMKCVLMTAALFPLFGMLEGICVLYTWFTPENKNAPSFHVVTKEYEGLHKEYEGNPQG